MAERMASTTTMIITSISVKPSGGTGAASGIAVGIGSSRRRQAMTPQNQVLRSPELAVSRPLFLAPLNAPRLVTHLGHQGIRVTPDRHRRLAAWNPAEHLSPQFGRCTGRNIEVLVRSAAG